MPPFFEKFFGQRKEKNPNLLNKSKRRRL